MVDSASYREAQDSPGVGTSATSGSNTSASSSVDQQQQQSSSDRSKKQKNSVQWAGKIADNTTDFATNAARQAENLTTGVTQLVGWTYENTKVESRGVRPMHVRVSVRVHHVSFLHPGLDTGSRATISDTKKGRFRFGKKHKKQTGPPGLLKFGKRSGSWKSQGAVDLKHQLKEAAKDVPWSRSQEDINTDPSDVAEIVNAEAFRLSRDGIIQQHYALERALPKSSSPASSSKAQNRRASPNRFTVPQLPMHLSPTAAAAVNPTQYNNTSAAESVQSSNLYSSMLSPESMEDPMGAARYYKECAARPKGYRRLVVSSLPQRNGGSMPSPPKSNIVQNLSSSVLGASLPRSLAGLGEGSFSFETNGSAKDGQARSNDRPEKKDGSLPSGNNEEHNFDNVEYRYVGPPKTGPDFFQLLRKHGAATFGRYLPELACSVPNHSYTFELVKSKKRTGTQPIVYECPHVIWGDARDKMLSRIAKEGCPLIDARQFEYVSNSNFDDARLSESLLLCGSTLWVKRAKDEDNDEGGQLESKNKKKLVEAEYHAAKFYDGVKDGVKGGVKGLQAAMSGAQGVVGVVEKGAQEVISPKVLPSNEDKSSGGKEKEKKKSKLRSIFPSKRKQKRKDDDGLSVDGSFVSGQDDYSIASEQVAIPSLELSDHIGTVDGVDEEKVQEVAVKTPPRVQPSAKLQSTPYVLLLDDVIDIRIVSFPDKIEIANFPISVASVMVQRSMEDRLKDPFKPSELTCNFIQEPSAPELRWGVTLKVTVRAVQVRPSKVPSLCLSPKINQKLSEGKAEVKRFKDKLKSMGKDDEEVKKEVAKREEKINRDETELDKAIVEYGYDRNDDNEYGPKEIRLRQMFYCEREHESAIIKSKRRQPLTEDEMQLISDASMDPTSVTNKPYEKGEMDELLRLLDIHFPGIDDEMYLSKMRGSITSSLTPASGSEEAMTTIPLSDDVEPTANDVFASVSLAMATSLDKCFGEDIGVTKTAQAIKQQIFTASTIKGKKLDANASKLWVLHMSKKLASCLHEGTTIQKVQKMLLESVMEDDVLVEEEMKMDEDQIALSESEESGCVDAVELADWCTAVASKLEECAMELEAMYSPSELDLSDHSSVDDNEATGDEHNVRPDPPEGRSTALPPTILSMMAPKNSDDNDMLEGALLEGMIDRQLSVESDTNTGQRMLISTIDEALPKSTQISSSKVDELLKKMKDSHFMKKKSSRYGSKKRFVSELDDTQREMKRADALKKQYVFYAILVVIAISLVSIASGKNFRL